MVNSNQMAKITLLRRHTLYRKISESKKNILLLIAVIIFGYSAKTVFAQTISNSPSVLYIPLIGITSVPDPLALPNGPGYVTYQYAVKNFLTEIPLSNVKVIDDNCSPIKFITGDDNNNSLLDYSETWRYTCTTKVSQTTQSTATAIGTANSITATHKAYATVIVGSKNPPPLVSIVNVSKVAYPLSLPSGGGNITFTYRVNNPGLVPLNGVIVTDDKCGPLSDRLGDTNGNNLLDVNEVWIYTCTTRLTQTTTNTVSVSAFANGLKAVDNATITVNVATPIGQAYQSPKLPIAGTKPETNVTPNINTIVWAVLSGILVILFIVFLITRKKKPEKTKGIVDRKDRIKKQ